MSVRTLPFLVCLSVFSSAFAGGMYLPVEEKLPKDKMEKIRLTISPSKIEDLANGSVLRIPGCSATFLSENGLYGTNWHCAQTCVQKIQEAAKTKFDTELSNINDEGFIADSREKEMKCVGSYVEVPLGTKNISSQFKAIDEANLKPEERQDAVRKKKEQIRAACMKNEKNTVCEVAFMNNEPEPYYLYRYKRITDVRLVWNPPHIVGEFGGLIDNWEYPRHAGDFAFFRAYEDNHPYPSKKYARVSSKGVDLFQPLFILGYPGRTERNTTSYAANFFQTVTYPFNAFLYGALIKSIEAKAVDPINSAYGRSWHWLENHREYFQRKATLMSEMRVVVEKDKLEEKQSSNSSYLERIRDIYFDAPHFFRTMYLLDFMTSGQSPAKSIEAAAHLWNWATQPPYDMDRTDERYKSWNKGRIESDLAALDLQFAPTIERAVLAKYFEIGDQLPEKVFPFEELKAKTRMIYGGLEGKPLYDQMSDVLLSKTLLLPRDNSESERIRALNARMQMMQLRPADQIATGDSLLLFAKGLLEQARGIRNHPAYGEAYTHELGDLNYRQNLLMNFETPDANNTMRFTYGYVQDSYNPTYKPGQFPRSTTLSSLIEMDGNKADSESDRKLFMVPAGLKDAQRQLASFKKKWFYDSRLRDIPVNFITNHVTARGSSGSSVFNNDGEVVGFVFDGTPESILSDIWPHPASRSIVVDFRYIGFLGTVIYPNAHGILKELGLP